MAVRVSDSRRLLWLLAWLVATAALIAFIWLFDGRAALSIAAQAKLGWIALAVLANFLILPLLMFQWWQLLPRPRFAPRRRLWDAVTLGIGAMNTLPFGGGHAVTLGLLAKRVGIGVPGAVSLLALEHLCDGLAKLALLVTALSVAPLPSLRSGAWLLAVVLIVALLGALWLAHHPTDSQSAHDWCARWSRHFEVLKRPHVLALAIAYSLLIRIAGLVGINAVQRNLSVDLPLTSTVLVLASVTVGTAVTLAPSDLGVYDASGYAAYRWLGVGSAESTGLALLQHLCFLLPVLATAYGVTFWRLLVTRRQSITRPSAEVPTL